MKNLYLSILITIHFLFVVSVFPFQLIKFKSNKQTVSVKPKSSPKPTMQIIENRYKDAEWHAIKIPKDGNYIKETVDGIEGVLPNKNETVSRYIQRKTIFKSIAVINGGFHNESDIKSNNCRIGISKLDQNGNYEWTGSIPTPRESRWCYGMNSSTSVFDIKEMTYKDPNIEKWYMYDMSSFEKAHQFGISNVGALFVYDVVNGISIRKASSDQWPSYDSDRPRSILAISKNNDVYLIVCGPNNSGWTWEDSCDFLESELIKYDSSFKVKYAVMHDGSTCAQLGYRFGTTFKMLQDLDPNRGVMSKFRGFSW